MLKNLLLLLFLAPVALFGQAPPASPEQGSRRAVLDFINLRFGMFIHFGMCTFHGEQWAYPFRDPKVFKPEALDCGQWARAARSAGMRYAVFTTKHHDGFCLWPTETTGYSVAKGETGRDIVREYVDAFRREGLRPGFYFSVWDWHHRIEAGKITPAKVQFIRDQLTELLTNYGPVLCIVFDGWGSKWGGPDFAELPYAALADHIHSLQPDCLVINHSCRTDLDVTQVVHFEATHGQHCSYDNTIPAQQGPTLQPAWFWNPGYENAPLKSARGVVEELRYANARVCNYLLNCAPNPRGLMDENVVRRLAEIGALATFPEPLAALPPVERPHRRVTASASSALPDQPAAHVLDGNLYNRWQPAEGDKEPWVEVDFGQPETFNAVVCGESPPKIGAFKIEAFVDGKWKQLAAGGKMTFHFAASFPEVTAQRYRLVLLESKPGPRIAELTLIRY
jgi:alpha-L-fucosidase